MITEKIDAILNSVSQRVEKLIPSGRLYIVLNDPKKRELSFPLVRDSDKGRSTDQPSPWDPRPCSPEKVLPDLVIMGRKSLLYENSSRFEKEQIQYWPGKDTPQTWLGVPMKTGEQIIGALVVESWQKAYSFSKNDEITLTTVARQAAIAIENVHLYDQLERKIEILRILNDFGRQFAKGLVKHENKILELVYESMKNLQLDTRNVTISLYDPDPDKPDIVDELYGQLRFAVAAENGQLSPMASRVARRGLTEYVIRTKESFYPPDVQKISAELAPDSHKPRRSCSWLGVPMLSDGQVFGVIVLRNWEMELAFSSEEIEILEALANHAAIALQNLRLYQAQKQVQEQQAAAENMAIMNMVAAEFAHKVNNLAGTIPVRIAMAKEQLDRNNSRDVKIFELLTRIEKETDGILNAAQEIKQSSIEFVEEQIDVNQLLETAIARAQNNQINKSNHVEITLELSKDLNSIVTEKNSLLDVLTSIIKNGYEAIEDKGTITITTHNTTLHGRKMILVKIEDTGKGIPTSDLPKIFDLFYTTKGEKGLGFGLWRDRLFIKRLGGEIDVDSEENKGSTFTIRIPVRPDKRITKGGKL